MKENTCLYCQKPVEEKYAASEEFCCHACKAMYELKAGWLKETS